MTKEQVIEAVKEMPQDFELEVLIERLIFIEKVEEGIKDANEGRVMSHEDVDKISKGWSK
jgi:predicted transcriptional regulator